MAKMPYFKTNEEYTKWAWRRSRLTVCTIGGVMILSYIASATLITHDWWSAILVSLVIDMGILVFAAISEMIQQCYHK